MRSIVILLLSLTAIYARNLESTELEVKNEIQQTYMVVEIHPIPGEWVRVLCWSGDHNKDQDSGPTTVRMDLTWDFLSNPFTKFSCSATRGNGRMLTEFSVFGGTVPQRSSTWKVDAEGKRRIRENGVEKNDYFGGWV